MKGVTLKTGKRSFLRIFFTPALFLLIGVSVWAEEDVYRQPLDSRTMGAFKEVTALLAKNPYVKGDFEQEKILSRLNRSLKSSGHFIITSGEGMVWDTLKPFPSTMTLGRDFLIQSRPGAQKTILSAAGNETFIGLAEVMSAVFSGNAGGLLDNFEVFFTGNAAAWEMGLIPKSKAIAAFAARITMKGDSAIKYILVSEMNGDSIKYLLSNHSYPPELTSNEKSFFTLP